MKAICFERYGPPEVLELREIPKPAPQKDEVLIRIHATSLNDWDWGAMNGAPFVNRLIFGLRKPARQILGSDIAGCVEEVGAEVSQFRPGDEVFGDLSGRWGGLAEYVCAPAGMLTKKGARMTFRQAAAMPQAGLLALQGLRDCGNIRTGQKVLINGAGGGVGTFAIQIAKLYGAEITAVDAAEKHQMLLGLGAARVLDHTQVDFTREQDTYDLVLDVKTNRPARDYIRVLKPAGTYVTVGGMTGYLLQLLLLGPWFALTGRRRLRILALKPNQGLAHLRELFDAGKLLPVIDRSYALPDSAEAFRRFGAALHRGKLIIDLV